ncbi:FAD-binding oxidoreductase [Microbispora sp. ATCC PTA-5024]|uniref:FAD-binding oxidoreductase n=1 Tax=Microbispora sp. ATCC PTA-5024 TaxID=316330 RepID=UPI0003DDE4C6|nr:FAD-dependent oxidoreductase [Microbispora sp. ATCC PTA-5024]ETK37758.1 hypothetical protein MPTA5024_02160 [Microbispora sp. ATCC PTA-5024]
MSTAPLIGSGARLAQALGGSAAGFAGRIALPGEAGYDRSRWVWRDHVHCRPAAIASATGAADVRAAVLAARDLGEPFAVRATGHGQLVPFTGGLLLNTSAMSHVRVDPARSMARVGCGARLRRVIEAALPFGLAPISGSSPWVGAAGYTLGGGTGLLARKYGFAADSLLGGELVTADGRITVFGPGDDPDLLWALRGGGGNFGVVTSLDIRLHPVGEVYSGSLALPISRAAELIAFYRDWVSGQPDELVSSLVVVTMPDAPDVPDRMRGRRVVVVRATYLGPARTGEGMLTPFRRGFGRPLLGGFRAMDYAAKALIGPPRSFRQARDHVALLPAFPDAVLDALVAAADSALPLLELRHWGGATTRVSPEESPVGHRDVVFSVTAEAPIGSVAAESDLVALADRLRPHSTGRSFLNFLNDASGVENAYQRKTYRRLRELKLVHDPENFFRFMPNIRPSCTATQADVVDRLIDATRPDGRCSPNNSSS